MERSDEEHAMLKEKGDGTLALGKQSSSKVIHVAQQTTASSSAKCQKSKSQWILGQGALAQWLPLLRFRMPGKQNIPELIWSKALCNPSEEWGKPCTELIGLGPA